MPAERFEDIPLVSPEEALCLLTGLGCRAGAMAVPSPSLQPAADEGPAI